MIATKKTPSSSVNMVAIKKTPSSSVNLIATKKTPSSSVNMIATKKTPASSVHMIATKKTPGQNSSITSIDQVDQQTNGSIPIASKKTPENATAALSHLQSMTGLTVTNIPGQKKEEEECITI